MITPLKTFASQWWDEEGPFKILHQLAPLRLGWMLSLIPPGPKPLQGWRILDIGCGGGLIAEPLARLGAQVTGIDEVPEAIAAARQHAGNLPIDYIITALETYTSPELFDGIVALEVIEHVKSPLAFLTRCAQLLKPGGRLWGSTLNRTGASYLLGIVAAEYVLRWVPRGTHQWSAFITPAEITDMLKCLSFLPPVFQGLSFHPLRANWALSQNTEVNYFFSAKKME